MIVVVFILMFIITTILCYLWVKGIDNMSKNHSDYKGEDFLNWDDNKTHTEGKI